MRALFARIASRQPVAFVDPARYLCTDTCLVVRSGHPMYRDDDHLSTFGSRYLAPAFDGVFAGLALAHAERDPPVPAQASAASDRVVPGPAAGLR